ncbi:queuosine precursor transporter [Gammaproteobacteria bacterium]|nr:queuosine precursor transporter [Gammaproteobacteria bacterium]
MNELVLLLHILWVSLAAFASRRFGYSASVCLMVVYSILGNMMVLKQMPLFSLVVTTADVYTVGVILVLNFIREDFDDTHVYQAMKLSFLALVILSLGAYTQLAYQAIEGDLFSPAYVRILEMMPALVIKSACVYFIVQYIDNKIFSAMKWYFKDQYLMTRVLFSLIFSQCLDTVIFSIWALEGIAVSIWDIILFSSLVKIICSAVMMGYTSTFTLFRRLLEKIGV